MNENVGKVREGFKTPSHGADRISFRHKPSDKTGGEYSFIPFMGVRTDSVTGIFEPFPNDGCDGYDGGGGSIPPQKRASGPFIKKCCSPRNI